MDNNSTLAQLNKMHWAALLTAAKKPEGIIQISDLCEELGWDLPVAVGVVEDLIGFDLLKVDKSGVGLVLSRRGDWVTEGR